MATCLLNVDISHRPIFIVQKISTLYICMVSALAHVKNRIGQVVASLVAVSEGKGVKEEEFLQHLKEEEWIVG